MKQYKDFKYWFVRKGHDIFEVQGEQKPKVFLEAHLDSDHCKYYDGDDWDTIHSEFQEYKNRAEYMVGKQIEDVDSLSPESAFELYNCLLTGCYALRVIRGEQDPDKFVDRVDKCISWLNTNGFYNGPASTKYHDCVYGGLVKHSLKVVNRVCQLIWSTPFADVVPLDSAVLVALVHDWCKIGLYESYQKNVKNENTGAWDKVTAYRYNTQLMPLGHGVSSMFLASKFFNLSVPESLAIRWHMGKWRCTDSEDSELQQANETYPLVHLLQFADQLAIVKY